MTEVQQISLNSFVRKTPGSSALKLKIRSTGARLTRKGRSRNWLLQANNQQILEVIKLIQLSGEEGWFWVTKKLSESKRQLNHEELVLLARESPSMTVTELMAMTDCKLAEARGVLDQLEWE